MMYKDCVLVFVPELYELHQVIYSCCKMGWDCRVPERCRKYNH